MHPQWREFLENSAPITDGPLPIDQNIRVDLSQLGIIEVKGGESDQFLQGQLTSNIRQLTPTTGQLSSYCSPKGRMLALMRLFKRDDSTFMLLPDEILEPTLKRLNMFVMRAQVELANVGERWVWFGISGPDATAALAQHLDTPRQEGDAVISQDDVTILSLSAYQQRFIIFSSAEKAEAIWASLDNTFSTAAHTQWDLLDIHVGLPKIEAATTELFIPQMVNLDILNGVNFKKGCYTGQEVIARMHYLGKLKRRMYRAHVETDDQPRPGDEIASPQSSSGQGAGKIVTAAPAPEGGYELLIVAEIEAAESGQLHLKERSDKILAIKTLPYLVEPVV